MLWSEFFKHFNTNFVIILQEDGFDHRRKWKCSTRIFPTQCTHHFSSKPEFPVFLRKHSVVYLAYHVAPCFQQASFFFSCLENVLKILIIFYNTLLESGKGLHFSRAVLRLKLIGVLKFQGKGCIIWQNFVSNWPLSIMDWFWQIQIQIFECDRFNHL